MRGETRKREVVMVVTGIMSLKGGGATHLVLWIFEIDQLYHSPRHWAFCWAITELAESWENGVRAALWSHSLWTGQWNLPAVKFTWECQSHAILHSDHLSCLSQGNSHQVRTFHQAGKVLSFGRNLSGEEWPKYCCLVILGRHFT